MKIEKEIVVIKKKGTNNYLCDFKMKATSLAYEVSITKDIYHALSLSFEAYESNKETLHAMAIVVQGEVVKAKVTYELENLDGSEVVMNDVEKAHDDLEDVADVFGRGFYIGFFKRLAGEENE